MVRTVRSSQMNGLGTRKTVMSRISIHTKLNNVPATLEMVSPRFQQQRINPEPYGQPASNRIVLQNDEMVVRLYLHDRLNNREMNRMVKRMQGDEPEAIRLGDPVMAIQIIHPGAGWPDEHRYGPVSLLDCLPDQDWLLMQSQPPVRPTDKVLFGAAGTLQFNDGQPDSHPVSLRYDSITGLKQREQLVYVTVNSHCQTELVGCAVIEVVDKERAARLVEMLRCRQVRCLKANGRVKRILLFPHKLSCLNRDPAKLRWGQSHADLNNCPGTGKATLLRLARYSDPRSVEGTMNAYMQ